MKKTVGFLGAFVVIVVLASLLMAVGAQVEAQTWYCNHGDRINESNKVWFNNQWGRDSASTASQCIASGGRVQYKWCCNGSVKGWPSYVVGWHYGNPGGWFTSSGTAGIPSHVNNNFSSSISCSRNNQGTYTEIMNCSIDLWLCNNTSGCNGAEIMGWCWHVNQQPIGSQVGTYNGARVYKGTGSSAGGAATISYIGTCSLNRGHIQDAIGRGLAGSNWYVVGAEGGMELCQGEGTATISFSASGGGTSGGGGGSKTIVVRARGTSGGEQIRLTVGGSTVATWTLSTSMQNYTATTSNSGGVNVCFINDTSNRDVQIDYIQVNGSTRQSENQSYNTGCWDSSNNSCGKSNCDWLHCNGCIGYGDA